LRNPFAGLIPRAGAILIPLCLVSHLSNGQEKVAPAPVPRLADGRPDLGNGKGVWSPRIVDDISGNGGGEKDEKTRILQVYEGGAHMWRIIYMDGREHPKGDRLNPTYLGHSIGHWEGDTLVVDVVGFNDRTWLDAAGHPHTEQLHVVERYTRLDANTLHYEATIDDPGAYTKPWTVGWKVAWQSGWEPLEYICQENNRDVGVNGHMVGLRPGEKHP